MLSIIEGIDYGRVKLAIRTVTKEWPSVDEVWCTGDNVTEIIVKIERSNYLLIKGAAKLGDLGAEKVKKWRDDGKEICFVSDKFSGKFSRRLKLLSKKKVIADLGKGAQKKARELLAQLNLPQEVKDTIPCHTVTEVLNAASIWEMSGESEATMPPILIRFLRGRLPQLLDVPIDTLVRQLAALVRAIAASQTQMGWGVIREISKVAPGAVGPIFNISKRVDSQQAKEFLPKCGTVLSDILETSSLRDVPTSFVLLKFAEALEGASLLPIEKQNRRYGNNPYQGQRGVKSVVMKRSTFRKYK